MIEVTPGQAQLLRLGALNAGGPFGIAHAGLSAGLGLLGALNGAHPAVTAPYFPWTPAVDRAVELNRRGATERQTEARRRQRSNDIRRRARAAGLLDGRR